MTDYALSFLHSAKRDYPTLRLVRVENKHAIYAGTIAFTSNFQNKGEISDSFEIEIEYPLKKGNDLPVVRETSGRIPRHEDYHVNVVDGSMCLGAPLIVAEKYLQAPRLKDFINGLIVPFLYAFSFKEIHKVRPWGELAHGDAGILEFYMGEFAVDSKLAAFNLLKTVAERHYRGHLTCPCGSEKIIRKCHGGILFDFIKNKPPMVIFKDYVTLANYLPKISIALTESQIVSKRLAIFDKAFRNNTLY